MIDASSQSSPIIACEIQSYPVDVIWYDPSEVLFPLKLSTLCFEFSAVKIAIRHEVSVVKTIQLEYVNIARGTFRRH